MTMDHGASVSPTSMLDWALVAAAAIVLLWALWLALRHTVRPGETDAAHIKRRILDDESEEREEARAR